MNEWIINELNLGRPRVRLFAPLVVITDYLNSNHFSYQWIKLIKENVPQAIFFDWILMGTLSSWCSM